MKPTCRLRPATVKDVKTIQNFSRLLARFEKLEHLVTATEAQFRKTLFGKTRYAHVIIAEVRQGQLYVPAGMALYFFNYSTFKAGPGLYLEDLFVLPEYRSLGIGLRLLQELAKIARKKKCTRLEWVVIDWNTKAKKFYRRHGAKIMTNWHICRVTGEALKKL